MTAPARPRRSALYLPASNPRAIDKARTLACDVVILDLEDAVAPENKAAARAAAVAAVGSFGNRELVIRVNGLGTPWGSDDLAAVAAAPPDAVLLPKVDLPAELATARGMLGDGPALWAMVETCRAVLNLAALADGGGLYGLAALVAGTNDLAAELRCTPGDDRAPLLAALSHVVLAARAHGLVALDGVCNRLDDAAAIERECRQAAAWGFDGKTLIHPGQIAAANAAFTPDAAAVAHARAVIAAFADPTAGALRIDGRMVERLHLAAAHRIVAIAAAALPDAPPRATTAATI